MTLQVSIQLRKCERRYHLVQSNGFSAVSTMSDPSVTAYRDESEFKLR